MPDWLTVQEAAAYLKVDRKTIYRWCDAGLLPYFDLKSGGGRRFRREDLDDLLTPADTRIRSLQSQMARVYDSGNAEFQEVAVMVRRAVGAEPSLYPKAVVYLSLDKAERTNPPSTIHGRLILEARWALSVWLEDEGPRKT